MYNNNIIYSYIYIYLGEMIFPADMSEYIKSLVVYLRRVSDAHIHIGL